MSAHQTPHQALLAKLRDERCEGNAAALARKIGKDATYINRLFYPPEKAGAKKIGTKIMDACTEAFGLHPGFWDGVPAPDTKVVSIQSDASKTIASADAGSDIVIPQYDAGGSMGDGGKLLLADQPGLIKSWHVDQEWIRLNVRQYTSLANLCIVTGFGPSMKPMFNPGDPLLVDLGVKTIDHDAIFFFRVGDEGFIKQLQRIPDPAGAGKVIRAKSKNPDYDPFDILPSNPHFEIIGKVLTVWKSDQF